MEDEDIKKDITIGLPTICRRRKEVKRRKISEINITLANFQKSL